jgi:hypothetical protein
MGSLPSDRERRCLSGGERLLTQVKTIDLKCAEHPIKMEGASLIEIWETETFSGEARITVMAFDAAGAALRASIFESVQAAESWLMQP